MRSTHAGPPDRPAPAPPRARTLDLLSLGFSIPIATVIGGAVGWFLDARLDSAPWLFLLGLVFGIAAGMRNLLRSAAAAAREEPPAE